MLVNASFCLYWRDNLVRKRLSHIIIRNDMLIPWRVEITRKVFSYISAVVTRAKVSVGNVTHFLLKVRARPT
jgi:hypothetical protein